MKYKTTNTHEDNKNHNHICPHCGDKLTLRKRNRKTHTHGTKSNPLYVEHHIDGYCTNPKCEYLTTQRSKMSNVDRKAYKVYIPLVHYISVQQDNKMVKIFDKYEV